MPWTFAHPAAVLPVAHCCGSRLPLVGLAAGSLAPDVGYYLDAFGIATQAHTLRGVALCLPIGALLVGLLRGWRRPLIAPLPAAQRAAIARVAPAALDTPVQRFAMLAAVLIGALSHIAWDACTHAGSAVVQASALLRTELCVLAGRRVAVYTLLQHASTLIGLLLLIARCHRWLGVATPGAQAARWGRPRDYRGLAMIAVASGASGLGIAWRTLGAQAPLPVIVVRGVIDATVVFVIAYLLWGLWLTWRGAAHAPRW